MSRKPQSRPPAQRATTGETPESSDPIQSSGPPPTFAQNVVMTIKLMAIAAIVFGLIYALDKLTH